MAKKTPKPTVGGHQFIVKSHIMRSRSCRDIPTNLKNTKFSCNSNCDFVMVGYSLYGIPLTFLGNFNIQIECNHGKKNHPKPQLDGSTMHCEKPYYVQQKP